MREQLNKLNGEYREDLIKAFDLLVSLSNKTQDIIRPSVQAHKIDNSEVLYANLITVAVNEALNSIGAIVEQLQMGVEDTVTTIKKMGKDPKELNDECIKTIVLNHLEEEQPELFKILSAMV